MVTIDFKLLSAILGALATLSGLIVAGYKFFQKIKDMEDAQKALQETVERSGKTHRVLMEGLYACLDGLHQQGCNGNVTKGLEMLHKHLFEEMEQ